jgi:hypothetical protein
MLVLTNGKGKNRVFQLQNLTIHDIFKDHMHQDMGLLFLFGLLLQGYFGLDPPTTKQEGPVSIAADQHKREEGAKRVQEAGFCSCCFVLAPDASSHQQHEFECSAAKYTRSSAASNNKKKGDHAQLYCCCFSQEKMATNFVVVVLCHHVNLICTLQVFKQILIIISFLLDSLLPNCKDDYGCGKKNGSLGQVLLRFQCRYATQQCWLGLLVTACWMQRIHWKSNKKSCAEVPQMPTHSSSTAQICQTQQHTNCWMAQMWLISAARQYNITRRDTAIN